MELRNGVSENSTTRANGNYSFDLDISGYSAVTAMAPTGYVANMPEQVIPQVAGPDQHVTIDFGHRTWFIFLPIVARRYP